MNPLSIGTAIACCLALFLMTGPRNAKAVVRDLHSAFRPTQRITTTAHTLPSGKTLTVTRYATAENAQELARAREGERDAEIRALERWFNMPAAEDPEWLA